MIAEKIPRIEAEENIIKNCSYAGIVKGIPNTDQRQQMKITENAPKKTSCTENTNISSSYYSRV